MKNLSPISVWSDEDQCIIDGTFFKKISVCDKQKKKNCKKFYEKIKTIKGFHICPAGLSAYSTGIAENRIHTAIRVNGYYDITKTKNLPDYLPTIPQKEALEAIAKFSTGFVDSSITKNTENDVEIIDFSIHEIRKLNGEIKRFSEEILAAKSFEKELITKKVHNIYASSFLISVRLGIFDFEKNPLAVSNQSQYSAGVYRKFQKASHCLETYAKDHGVTISQFTGTSHLKIEMFPFFDFIPFVILENAIKYSPKNQYIEVSFDEVEGKSLTIEINSIGPACSPNELNNIFDKKFRGKHAQELDSTGGGYGLYFAKLICELHNIELHADSTGPEFYIDNICYRSFKITIEINV